MVRESAFDKQIRDDAENFLAHHTEVEKVIQGLTPASTLDESTALAVMERLDDLECLRFVAWSVSQGPEGLSEFLPRLKLAPEKIDRIIAFASEYSAYGLFLTRLNRTNQGYGNELTRLSGRASIQTFSGNTLLTLQLYNYDRVALTTSIDLDGLVDLISMLIETANDSIESIRAVSAEPLRNAVDPADVEELLQKAQTLIKLVESVTKGSPEVQ